MWSRFFCLPPRFRCEPQLAGDAHRVVPGKTHTLGADYTVRWERVIYRVKREHIAADMRGARVQLERRLDGSRWLRWRRQVVALEACGRRPGPGQPPRQARATLGKSAQEKARASSDCSIAAVACRKLTHSCATGRSGKP